eukprot:COSAG01_NODE_8692_length_2695_cov_4.327427_1_plen_164_part_10
MPTVRACGRVLRARRRAHALAAQHAVDRRTAAACDTMLHMARQGTNCFWRGPVGQQKSAQRHEGRNRPSCIQSPAAGTEDDRLHEYVRHAGVECQADFGIVYRSTANRPPQGTPIGMARQMLDGPAHGLPPACGTPASRCPRACLARREPLLTCTHSAAQPGTQ